MTADALQTLFERFRLHARTFFAGNLCAPAHFDQPQDHGHLHLVRAGRGEVRYLGGRRPLKVQARDLLFHPRHLAHELVPEGPEGLDLVCATITFGTGVGCPLALALPEVMQLRAEQVGSLAELIFQEAFAAAEGRQAVLDRLCEVALVHFVRHALGAGEAHQGLLAGLLHPQLRHALIAMHDDPARPWTLAALAAAAGRSRSGFALEFKRTVGLTPGEHLVRFRIATAQERLAAGVPLKVAAFDVGYGSSTALSRAFRQVTGQSPRDWLQGQRRGSP